MCEGVKWVHTLLKPATWKPAFQNIVSCQKNRPRTFTEKIGECEVLTHFCLDLTISNYSKRNIHVYEKKFNITVVILLKVIPLTSTKIPNLKALTSIYLFSSRILYAIGKIQ
jgi:hypothetical protein